MIAIDASVSTGRGVAGRADFSNQAMARVWGPVTVTLRAAWLEAVSAPIGEKGRTEKEAKAALILEEAARAAGHCLATQDWWGVAAVAWRHRWQLRAAGVAVEDLALPERVAGFERRTIGWDGQHWGMIFRAPNVVTMTGPRVSMDIVAWAQLPGMYFVGRGTMMKGIVKAGRGQALALQAAALLEGWDFSEEAEEALARVMNGAAGLEVASRAVTQSAKAGAPARDEEHEGGSECEVRPLIVERLGVQARPYQVAGIEYLCRVKRGFLADDMGLGKTGQALGVLQRLNAFPAIVVTLAICKEQWAEEVKRWLPGARAVVWEGRGGALAGEKGDRGAKGAKKRAAKKGKGGKGKALGEDATPTESVCGEAVVHIVNYDIVAARLEELKALGARAVVCDESQRLTNGQAQRTKAVIELGKRRPVRLCLSGTPAESNPAELMPQLRFLGRLNDVGGWDYYARRFCAGVRRQVRGAAKGMVWDMAGPRHGTREWRDWQEILRRELSPALRGCCLLRRERQDVLTELPPKVVTRVPIALSEDGKVRYASAEADVAGWLAMKAGVDAGWEATVAGLPVEEREMRRAARVGAALEKLDGMELLLRLGTLRQVAGEAKLAGALAWLEHLLESGRKVVVFAHHRAIVRGVAAHFNCGKGTLKHEGREGREAGFCGVIDGETSGPARARAKAAFVDERSGMRMLALNLTAGGTGLDGLQHAGADVVFLEEPWTPAGVDQAVARVWRMGQTKVVHEWHLMAPGTVEQELWERIEAKRAVTGSAMGDGEADRRAAAMDMGRAVAAGLAQRRI